MTQRTAWGWQCTPCRIYAGHPDAPIGAWTDQAAAHQALTGHVRDTHHGTTPDGAEVVELVASGRLVGAARALIGR